MKPIFIIFVETVTGEIIRAFTWCHDEFSGIEKARREAAEFGVTPVKVWAERTNETML